MKKIFAMGVASAFAISSAFAQATETDTIEVSSTVAEECDVDAVATGINLTVGLDQQVASVTVECNIFGQVDITFDSPDGTFELTDPANPAVAAIPYTIDVEFDNFVLVEVTDIDNGGPGETRSFDNTGGQLLDPVEFPIRVNIDPDSFFGGPGGANPGQLFAGSRTDELSITISAS